MWFKVQKFQCSDVTYEGQLINENNKNNKIKKMILHREKINEKGFLSN